MNHNIKIIDPLEINNWDELILDFKDYSFFHSAAWSKVISETYNYKRSYFTIMENGAIKAGIPLMVVKSFITGKRAISLPFSDYCEPLIKQEINFNDVIQEVKNFCIAENLKYLEFRGGNEFFDNIRPSTFDYNHILDLTAGQEILYKNLSSNTKRNIKKAIREEVKVENLNSLSALEDFYMMNCATRKKHGLPPQPKKFFMNLFEYVIAKNKGFISIARYQGNTIAGAVYLLIGKKALYKFGASYLKFQNLRPNNLVMWEAIKHCLKEGYESFCFGRTEPENDGLRKFKLGFGTSEKVLNIYRYDFKSRDFLPIQTKTTGLHNKIFDKTPLPLLKIFGSIFYKHFG